MGIQNLSIRKTATSTRRSYVEIRPNDSTTGICFSWDVLVGGTRSWTYGIEVWGVSKGGSSQVGLGGGWHEIELAGTDTENGAQFQVGVNTVLSTAGLAQYVQSFSARQYDYLRFKFRVRPSEYPIGYTQDIVAEVMYVPSFTNVAIGYSDSNTLKITGNLSGWAGGGTLGVSALGSYVKSRIQVNASFASNGAFTAYLPVSKLTSAPRLTDNGSIACTMSITPNYTASWFDQALTATTVSYAMGGVSGSAERNADGSVTVRANFGSNSIGSATAKLDGGTLACDTASIRGGSVTFQLAPMGAHTYTITASNASGTAHASVTVSAPAWRDDLARIVREDGTAKVEVMYTPVYNDSGEAETADYKLSGRPRPSVFYGTGGTCEWGLSYQILTSDRQAADSARALQYGTVFAEFPTGERFKGHVSNVDVQRENAALTSVSMTIMEVA